MAKRKIPGTVTLDSCVKMNLDSITQPSGTLTVVENGTPAMPFDIKRIFYLHNLADGAVRGGHAHIASHEIIIPVSGGFTLTLDDAKRRQSFKMDSPTEGMYIAPGIWRTLSDFAPDTVVLVLTSECFTEDDYIRDYNEYVDTVSLL